LQWEPSFSNSATVAIGTIGNILQMVCPHPGIRGAFGGVTYNFGNAISSVAPTIETRLGDDLPTKSGKQDYGRVILILVGILSASPPSSISDGNAVCS
jgi:SHS family lactate transporter-like MFS transporter